MVLSLSRRAYSGGLELLQMVSEHFVRGPREKGVELRLRRGLLRIIGSGSLRGGYPRGLIAVDF